jgi:ribosomal-protein-alanine N-acetyltransferase
VIRAARPDDLPAMAAIHAQCFPDPWNAQSLAQALAAPGVFALVAAREDALSGLILARVAAEEAEILTVAVAPALRRGGTGRSLVAQAARLAQDSGALVFYLEVSTANVAAQGLYRGLGFAEAGRRKGYYAGPPPQDALILKADLPLRPAAKAD